MKGVWASAIYKYGWVGSGLKEFILNVLFSATPMLLGVLGLMLVNEEGKTFGEAVMFITNKGELIIYSATLMAPILYAIQKEPPPKLKGLLLSVGVSTLVVGSFVYATGLSGSFSGFVQSLTVVCFGLALLVFLILNLVEHKTEHAKSAPLIIEDKKNAELAAYSRHKGV